MISDAMVKFLIIQYVVILLVCLWENNWPKSLYWLGAAILNIGLLWGMGK